jgi:hypothetical protein
MKVSLECRYSLWCSSWLLEELRGASVGSNEGVGSPHRLGHCNVVSFLSHQIYYGSQML